MSFSATLLNENAASLLENIQNQAKLGIDYQVLKTELSIIADGGAPPVNIKVKEDIMQGFWLNRWKETRRLTLVFTTSSFVFQLRAIISPLNDQHFKFNLAYMGCTAVIYLMLALSYRSENLTKLVQPTFILLILRNTFRLLDFE